MLILYLHLATGASYSMVFRPYLYVFANPIALVVSWVHLLFIIVLIILTVRTFRNIPIVWDRQKQTYLFLGWIVYLLLHFPYTKFFIDATLVILKSLVYVSIVIGIARMILLTALIIYTLSWYKWTKEK